MATPPLPGAPPRAYRDVLARRAQVAVKSVSRYYTEPERLRPAIRAAIERTLAELGPAPAAKGVLP